MSAAGFEFLNEEDRSADPKILADFERSHDIEIPESFRALLTERNGGGLGPGVGVDTGRVPGLPGITILGVLGVCRGDAYDLGSALEAYGDRVPEDFLPLALAEGGNLILIRGDGEIWFWDHEREPQDGRTAVSRLTRIAGSLTSFAASLTELGPEELPRGEGWTDPSFKPSFD